MAWLLSKFLPSHGIIHAQEIEIETHTSLNELVDRLPLARELCLVGNVILSVDSSRSLSPMPTVDSLIFDGWQFDGSEQLLNILPRLRSIRGPLLALFVAIVRHSNIGTLLNGVEKLEIYEKEIDAHSIKQWLVVLSCFPRLRSLFVCMLDSSCPSLELADLLANNVEARYHRLVVFSFYISPVRDQTSITDFVSHLRQRLEKVNPSILVQQEHTTGVETWN
jgi:hypothetical protein